METRFTQERLNSPSLHRANQILRRCVHCGLCNAACPTYQLLGDELDSPRGRIYLIKSLLETPDPSHAETAQTHLDRCLTCRACETTCPSGVAYGELLEIGREAVEQQAARSIWQKFMRRWLGWVVPSVCWFRCWAALGRWVRWALPSSLAVALPKRPSGRMVFSADAPLPAPSPAAMRTSQRLVCSETSPLVPPSRRALLLAGCVQRSATPATNAAAARYLNARGVETVTAEQEGCCGALNLHLGQTGQARRAMQRNLDALAPLLDQVEWIVSTASGCGVTMKDYGRLLADSPRYAAPAAQSAAMVRDLAEVAIQLEDEESPRGFDLSASSDAAPTPRRIAWHSPCTLQHGQRVNGQVERLLAKAGYELTPVKDAHLCCGAAGTYSVLQPQLAERLQRNKLANLIAGQPDLIATANIGCQVHLASAADRPVLHWMELLADAPAATDGGALRSPSGAG